MSSWRRIIVPTEHGGWGFLAEPIVLGLVVAPSLAGPFLAIAFLAGFLARQPLKLAAMDRTKGNRYPRTVAAERAVAVMALTAALSLAAAVLLGGGGVLRVLGLAAPLAAVTLVLDLSGRSRSLLTELLAPLALAAAAPAMAAAAGWTPRAATGLWALLAVRALTSIPYVRTRLRLERGQSVSVYAVVYLQLIGVLVTAMLASTAAAPRLGVAAMLLLAARAVHGVSPWRRRARAKEVGVTEVVFGALFVLLAAVGYLTNR